MDPKHIYGPNHGHFKYKIQMTFHVSVGRKLKIQTCSRGHKKEKKNLPIIQTKYKLEKKWNKFKYTLKKYI